MLGVVFGAVFGAVLVAAEPGASARPNEPVSEKQAKALFVFHLTQFVTWPEPPRGDVFKVGVLGSDSFALILEAIVRGEKAAGCSIQVRRAGTTRNLTDCQVVFISQDAWETEDRALRQLARPGILTVGESDDFLARGGMIRLKRTPQRKLRLQINLDAVRAAKLQINSHVLRLADVVQSGGP